VKQTMSPGARLCVSRIGSGIMLVGVIFRYPKVSKPFGQNYLYL